MLQGFVSFTVIAFLIIASILRKKSQCSHRERNGGTGGREGRDGARRVGKNGDGKEQMDRRGVGG